MAVFKMKDGDEGPAVFKLYKKSSVLFCIGFPNLTEAPIQI